MKSIEIGAIGRAEVANPMWTRLITAGRAHEGLRKSWQEQLSEVQKEIGFDYIRFHGLLCDEMAIVLEGENGELRYNFTYVDELFDFLLSVKIRPFVEFGFMPTTLADGDKTIFWWEGNISMPKDMRKWKELIENLMIHWVHRYGKEEVLQWYFEVWNEPNLEDYFFDGKFADYMELYQATTNVIKNMDQGFRVGGPATSNFKNGKAPWVEEFLEVCKEKELYVDFVSTHPYPNNFPLDGYGSYLECYRDENSLKTDLTWLKETVKNSNYPDAEIHITEWNNSPNPRDRVHDTLFMAPFIIKNNLDNTNNTDSLGYWAFTDIFEEKSPGEKMFHGGFGLINKVGLKKAGYWAYHFLSKLGTTIVEQADDFIVTKNKSGYQILAYNYCHYNEAFSKGDREALQYYNRYGIFEEGCEKEFLFTCDALESNECVIKTYSLDRNTGSAYDKWIEFGKLEFPTQEELDILKDVSKPSVIMTRKASGDSLEIEVILPVHGVTFIDITIKK